MKVEGRFCVSNFAPLAASFDQPVVTALPVAIATMVKSFEGEIDGRSSTLLTSAFDQGTNVGTYVAMESFEGSLAGKPGTFNFIHAASSAGSERVSELFSIVPGSGTDSLTGIRGNGGISIDEDGTHRIWFECELD